MQAPTRYPIDWKNPEFYAESALLDELERVFDHCHGCRRCVNLCNAFPTLFDLVDESSTQEIDGVARKDYSKVVDQCYLCDLCYQTKCPYIPPHEWKIDFPHLMLRAKAVKFHRKGASISEKSLSSTDTVGRLAGIPIVVNVVNAANRSKPLRRLLELALGVHPQARIPHYHSDTLRKRHAASSYASKEASSPSITTHTRSKVAIFATCFANYNEPGLGEDLIKVLVHNDIAVELIRKEQCCGMPKLELGDLEAANRARKANIPVLMEAIEKGWDIIAPVPSCVLMFRQQLPLLFPEDKDVKKVSESIFDPFEYLMLHHRKGLLNLAFKKSLGRVAYHVACHQRVQKIGLQTKKCLELVPNTEVLAIERCSGHDGTYGVKSRSYEAASKIARPVIRKIRQSKADYYGSDCPMAGRFIEHGLADGSETTHPISLLRAAYSI